MANTVVFEKIPYHVKPVNYKLVFRPNMKTYIFTGDMSLEVKVEERTDQILLNARDLEVYNVVYGNLTAEVVVREEAELVILKFPSPLETGTGTLSLNFKGNHNDLMKGFYRSKYTDLEGVEKYLLCTQFESTDARRAFPCIDEPDRKATFSISMIVPSNLTTLSNMPESNRTPVPKPAECPDLAGDVHYVKVDFETSPIMSTYLLAMVVGEFDFIESADANGVKVRVYTPLGKKHCADFAMNVAVKALPFYADCFGIAYPLPKMDLIAIPDFAAGAMENWGLVTYRETALLIDPLESSLALKQRVALVVAHELAHMWFGNLVTMRWWTHLWLNEGFATWMEYLCVSRVLPEFEIWNEFSSSEQSTAFDLDGLKSSHPIEVEVKSPQEVEEIFDSISYAKGASIINMLYYWIGHESFFNGLKAYIDKFKYSNAQTEDLWAALGAASGKPVNEVMSTWTKKMGYPAVMIDNSPGKDDHVVLQQKRFLADGTSEAPGSESHWLIPICLGPTTGDEKQRQTHLMPMDGQEHTIALQAGLKPDKILVNPNRAAFYRVLYAPSYLDGIKNALQTGGLGARDRLAIIDDQFSLAFAGAAPIANVLDLLTAYVNEDHHVVWGTIAQGLGHIRNLLEEVVFHKNGTCSPDMQPLKGLDKLVQRLAVPVLNKLTWDQKSTESYNDTMLRPIILSVLGSASYEPVVEEAKSRFNRHYETVMSATGDETNKSTALKADIRATVFRMCNRKGGKAEYEKLLALHDKATMQDEKVRILQSLGATHSTELREKTFQMSLSDKVRKQDRFICLIGARSAGPEGRLDFWKFVQSRIDALPEDMGSQHLMSHVLKNSCRNFVLPERLSEVRNFFEKHPVPCRRAIEQAIEEITINIAQVERDYQGMHDYLIKF